MKIDIYSIMIMAISIMFVLITFYLWLKYGKEDNDMEVIEEFYPPKECNSLETGYIYKRYIDKKDVVSLLIYLANKGYLKIEQTTDQGIFKKSKGFRIIKIKEYEGNNEIEKIFLEELFFHSDNSVTGLQLKDNFEKATEKVKKIISDNKENKEKFFLPRPKKVIKNLTAMILLMYALITIKPIIEFYGIIFGWILALFQMIITIIGFVFLFISIWGNGPKTTKIVLAIFGNICIIPTLINIIWPALLANKNNFKLVIAYHTQGKEIYWQFANFNPPNSFYIGTQFAKSSGYKLTDTPYNSSFAGYKDWFIQDYNKPGYTIEAGIGESPLPISQFDEIYRDNIGILILGAVL